MSEELREAAEKLTVKDPVDQETMRQLEGVINARSEVANKLANIRLEEIHLLAAIRQLDNEKETMFEAILSARGLPGGTVISLNTKGEITVLEDEDG